MVCLLILRLLLLLEELRLKQDESKKLGLIIPYYLVLLVWNEICCLLFGDFQVMETVIRLGCSFLEFK